MLYAISVKLGFAMAGNVFKHMHVAVLYKMQFALNAREVFGIMEEDSSSVHSAMGSYVKMISLNTRLHVKYWNRKIINVRI